MGRKVPIDVIKEVYNCKVIRGRQFVIGSNQIRLFGSLPIMALRSEYFSAFADAPISVSIMADHHVDDVESLQYIWSYLNGFYEIGRYGGENCQTR